MKALCSAVLLLSCAGLAPAQQAPSLEKLLDHLVAYAAEYRAKMPSLECEEDFVSQQVKGDKVKWEVAVTATLRQIRGSGDPDDFKDSYIFHTVNGGSAPDRFKMPYFVEGAFANGIGFGGQGGRDCYEHRLSEEDGGATTRLEFWVKEGDLPAICKDVYTGYRKVVLVDKATGAIRHITRSMSAEAARKNHEPDFASIEYAPQKLGELEMWLPVRIETHNAKNDRRMTATFSNYHRFAGEVRILPGVEAVEADESPKP